MNQETLIRIAKELRSCAYEIEKAVGEGHIMDESDYRQVRGQYDILCQFTMPTLEAEVKGSATR